MASEAVDNDGPPSCLRCGGPLPAGVFADIMALCARCAEALKPPPGPQPADESVSLVGAHLDDFEIIERIGGGPTGALYKARQRSIDRIVTLKILPENLLDSSGAVARFQEEARALACVTHPNVIEVFKSGCADLWHFIAMEPMEGESLASLLEREGRVPADQALPWMKQLASALAELHAARTTHCDIQPAHILITPDGRAKLTGFGLARRIGDSAGAGIPGELFEARLYFPPEVARARPFDGRSDLYLLGATFYHAIGGRPPFEGSAEERALLHVRNDVPPLNHLAPNAPVALCMLIHKLLRREPDERYQSATDVVDALERIEAVFQRTEAATRRTGPVWSRAARPEGRRAGQRPPEPRSPGRPHEEPSQRPALVERAAAKKEQGKRRTQIAIFAGAAVVFIAVLVALLARPARDGGSSADVPPQAALPKAAETVPREVTAPARKAPPPKAKEPPEPRPAPKSRWPRVEGARPKPEPEPKPEPAPTPQPKPDPMPKPSPRPEVVRLQAVAAKIHGSARYEYGDGKDNIGYWADTAWVSWEFDVAKPGAYEVEVVFAADRSANGNEYTVAVDNQRLKGKVRFTGSWTKFVAEKLGTLAIRRRGRCTLSIKPVKKRRRIIGLMNLKSVTLRPVSR
jgi:hypothetical protein